MSVAIPIALYLAAGVMVCGFIRVGKYFLFREDWELDEFRHRCGEDTAFITFLMVIFWPGCAVFWFAMFLGKAFFLLSDAIAKDILRRWKRANGDD